MVDKLDGKAGKFILSSIPYEASCVVEHSVDFLGMLLEQNLIGKNSLGCTAVTVNSTLLRDHIWNQNHGIKNGI